jgi:hypothetical protein
VTIENKLEQAKQNKSHHLKNIALLMLAITLVTVCVLLFISSLDNNKPASVEAGSDTLNESEFNAAGDSDAQNEQYREQYLNATAEYSNEIEPKLNNIDIEKWKKTESAKIDELIDSAVTLFGQSNYKTAYKNAKQANNLALSLISESESNYQEAMQKAANAYAEDNYESALFNVKQALMFNLTSQDASELLNKIEDLREILELMEQAKIARLENKHQQELNILDKIISLSPERKSVVERSKELKKIIKANEYSRKINQIYGYIKKENVSKAKALLGQLKKAYPSKPELNDIAGEIAELEKNKKIENWNKSAKTAVAKDDWKSASQYLKNIIALIPADAEYSKRLKQANDIVSLGNSLSSFIADPYRLSNKSYLAKAQSVIENSSTYLNDSSSLKIKSEQLEELIQKANSKVNIKILSDNNTHILVRGVGIVGKTNAKDIQLLPGQYKFEGKREGYKSKLVNVLVPYDKNNITLTIICDEQI